MLDQSDGSEGVAEPPEKAERPASGPVPSPRRPVQDMLDQIRHAADGPSVAVGDVMRAMDASSRPVLLLLPALILVSPLSGIPGLSSLGGLTIALVAAQILLGREAIWLPGFILRRRLATERLNWGLGKLDKAAAFIDRKSVPRAEWIFAFPGRHLLLITCMACGLIMPFFELVPFSATTLAVVVSILASGLLVRDGVVAGLGLGGFGLAVMLIAKLATP
ncbi:MAG: exopolysaccharide biosynthesis protein [Rhodobacteraceae bacterium]|nr:exopolysaccharide biosynthesis protein [Paracoccaceae bacterium]